MVDEAKVRIVGDASGVAPAVQLTKDQLAGLEGTLAALTASFGALSADIKASMASGASSTAEMAAEMRLVEAETEKETLSLREMAASAREGAEQLVEMKEAVYGIGELLFAVLFVEEIKRMGEGIAELSKEIGEAAEKVAHLAEQLGMSTRSVLELKAAATQSGTPFETLVRAADQLDKRFETEPKLFKQLGIDIPKNADQMTVLSTVMDRFHNTADGPQKVAAALALMGRNGAEMIPFLNKGSDALAEMRNRADELGAANTDAIVRGRELAEATNEASVAYSGLKATIADALAPALTDLTLGFTQLVKEFVDSYEKGGSAKTVLDDIGTSLLALGQIVRDGIGAWEAIFQVLGTGTADSSKNFEDFTSAIVGFLANADRGLVIVATTVRVTFDQIAESLEEAKGNWTQVIEHIAMWLEIGEVALDTFSKIASEALTLQWGSIGATWDAGMAQISDIVKTRGAQIANDAKATRDKVLGYFTDMSNARTAFQNYDNGGADATPRKPRWLDPGLEKAGTKPKPEIGTVAGPKKTKKGKEGKEGPSIVEKWRAELAESLNLEENWGADETKFSEAFWEGKRALVKKGSAEEIEIRKELAKDKKAIFKEEQQAEIQSIKAAQQAGLDAVKSAADLEKAEIQRKLANAEEAHKVGEMSAVKLAETRRTLMTDLYAIEANEANKEYELKRNALIQEGFLDHLRLDQKRAITNQLAQLERQHQASVLLEEKQTGQKLVALDRQVADAQRQIWRQSLQGFSQNLSQMLTGQQSFFTTVRNMWQSLRDIAAKAIENIVTNWLVGLATKTAAERAANQQSVIGDAKKAARGAYNAVVGIPVVGPILAPIAAATAFAAVEAFGYDVGAKNLSKDQLAVVHGGETIIPANEAGGWRNVMEMFSSMPKFAAPSFSKPGGGAAASAANSNARFAANDSSGSSGGDVHLHLHGQIIHGKKDIEAWVKDNAPQIYTGLKGHVTRWNK